MFSLAIMRDNGEFLDHELMRPAEDVRRMTRAGGSVGPWLGDEPGTGGAASALVPPVQIYKLPGNEQAQPHHYHQHRLHAEPPPPQQQQYSAHGSGVGPWLGDGPGTGGAASVLMSPVQIYNLHGNEQAQPRHYHQDWLHTEPPPPQQQQQQQQRRHRPPTHPRVHGVNHRQRLQQPPPCTDVEPPPPYVKPQPNMPREQHQLPRYGREQSGARSHPYAWAPHRASPPPPGYRRGSPAAAADTTTAATVIVLDIAHGGGDTETEGGTQLGVEPNQANCPPGDTTVVREANGQWAEWTLMLGTKQRNLLIAQLGTPPPPLAHMQIVPMTVSVAR